MPGGWPLKDRLQVSLFVAQSNERDLEGKAVAAPDAYAPTMIDYTYLADTTMGNGVCQNCTPELRVRWV